MKQFTIENQGIQTFLVYHLKEEELIDEVCYDMVHGNQIPGILPMFLSTSDGKRMLKYNISSRISLDDFFHGVVNRNGFLSVFSAVVNTLVVCDEYTLDTNYFMLDSQHIFVNIGTREAELLYIPVIHRKEPVDLIFFFKNMVFQTQFDPSENAGYVVEIIKYLDDADRFSIQGLKKKVDEIIKENEPGLQVFEAGRAKVKPLHYEYATQPEPAQANWRGPDSKNVVETSVLSSQMSNEEEKQSLNPEKKDVVEKKKRKIRDIFTNRKGKKSSVDITELWIQQEAAAVLAEVDMVKNTSSEDTLDEKKVFGAPAYIVREKTQERVKLDKQILKIGKERSFVDYCIMDNPTISRSHANIVAENGEYYIMDMNSKNHTFVNGRMIHSGDRVKLIHGSKIKLSDEEFQFYLES